MEICSDVTNNYGQRDMALLFKKKMDTDEEIVRHELIRVWTKILDKYAHKGAHVPSAAAFRQELIEKGVHAAAKAVADEHWLVFTWMVRDEIQKKIEKGLGFIDIDQLVEDIRSAQTDPALLGYLRKEIRNQLLFCPI